MKRLQNKSNLEIVGAYLKGERPFTQVGYVGDADKYIIRKVGETWTDAKGKQWIQKEYGPQTITPLMDMIREESNDKCSICGKEIRWGTRFDRRIFNKTRKCLDCLAHEETELKIKGQYKLYEVKKMIENELAYLNDVRQKLKESKEYLKKNKVIKYVNANGLVEEWKNEARKELLANLQKDWVTCLKKITAAEKEYALVNAKIDEALAGHE
jgi:hypothetical protein